MSGSNKIRIKNFLLKIDGAVAFEYALIAALVSVAIVAGATSVGSSTGNIYDKVDEEITGAIKR